MFSKYSFELNKNLIPNGEWKILKGNYQRNIIKYKCCSHPFVDLTLTIKLKRITTDYLIRFIVPCVLLSSLMILVFILPAKSGERIGLAVTLLLAVTVFQQLTGEFLPRFGIPLISQLYLFIMFQMILLLTFATIVILLDSVQEDNLSVGLHWFVTNVLRARISEDVKANFKDKTGTEPNKVQENENANNSYECDSLSCCSNEINRDNSKNSVHLHNTNSVIIGKKMATRANAQSGKQHFPDSDSSSRTKNLRDRANWKNAAARCNGLSIILFIVTSITGVVYIVLQLIST